MYVCLCMCAHAECSYLFSEEVQAWFSSLFEMKFLISEKYESSFSSKRAWLSDSEFGEEIFIPKFERIPDCWLTTIINTNRKISLLWQSSFILTSSGLDAVSWKQITDDIEEIKKSTIIKIRMEINLTWNIFMFMFLQMPVQIGLLTEAAIAEVTLERLFLVMNVSNMSL